MSSFSDVVTLDVGGHIYRTTMTTLTRYPDSMLGAMFGGDLETLRDDQGRYFIDRDGTLFRHVLNFLRTSQLVLPEDFKELPLLEIEADFYQIQPLIEALKEVLKLFKQRPLEKMSNPNDVVSLNVGGHIYTTTRATLMAGSPSWPRTQSMLSKMVRQEPGRMVDGRPREIWAPQANGAEPVPLRDDQGRYFIDRDGEVFRHVLNFLRIGRLILPEGFKELDLLEKEAKFYQIESLIKTLETRIMDTKERADNKRTDVDYYDDWDY